MAFVVKAWRNYRSGNTPVDAAGLIDIETRLSGYTDMVANTALKPTHLPGDIGKSFDASTGAPFTAPGGGDVLLSGTQTLTGVNTFSQSPIVPTRAQGDNSTKPASTAYADAVKAAALAYADAIGAADATARASKADLVGGVIPTSQIPAIALVTVTPVADRTAMLALTAQPGDVAVVASDTDGKRHTYMLAGTPASTFGNWVELDGPVAAVSSVNGQTGVVVLSAANVGAAATSHTHPQSDVTGLVTALALLAPIASPTFTGTATFAAAVIPAAINAQTGTTYTLVLADQSKVVTLNNASAITLTVPPNSSVAFPVGTTIDLLQIGAGQVTTAPGAGVTLRNSGRRKITGQDYGATLLKTATDTWNLIGGVA